MNDPALDIIYGVPRRPKMGDASGAAIIGAIALGLLTQDWRAAAAGGTIAAALANQKQSLEFAVRNYLQQLGYTVIHFYRAPNMCKVTFAYAPHSFWNAESKLPNKTFLTRDDRDDWLYGNLIQNEFPKIFQVIRPKSI